MTSKRLLIHVGYPKTATTTLQKFVFSKLSGVHYFGKPFSKPIERLEQSIITDKDTVFRQRLASHRELLAEALQDRPRTAALSHEGLLRYNRHIKRGGNPIERTCSRVASLFHGLAEETRVLITIRRQEDLIISFYQHFPLLKETGLNFHEYLATACAAPRSGLFGSLHYDAVAKLYAEQFGAENVVLVPYELLVHRPERFSAVVAAMIGVDPEEFERLLKGRTEKQGARVGSDRIRVDRRDDILIRLGRRLVPRGYKVTSLPGGRALMDFFYSRYRTSTSIAYRDEEISRIRALFAPSNRRLSSAYGVRLTDYDYAL